MMADWLAKGLPDAFSTRESGFILAAHWTLSCLRFSSRLTDFKDLLVEHTRTMCERLYQAGGWDCRQWIVDKTNYSQSDIRTYHEHLDLLFGATLMRIYMLRHPYEVIDSMRKRTWGEGRGSILHPTRLNHYWDPSDINNFLSPVSFKLDPIENMVGDKQAIAGRQGIWSLNKCCAHFRAAMLGIESLVCNNRTLIVDYNQLHQPAYREFVQRWIEEKIGFGLALTLPFATKAPTALADNCRRLIDEQLQPSGYAAYHQLKKLASAQFRSHHRRPQVSSPARTFPSFIGIGAQKAGTTWIYEQLREHPEIFMSAKKELNFFYSDKPVGWYQAQFVDGKPFAVRGEISPNYFVRPEIPQKIYRLIPTVKLFCILRDPTQRAFSQWKMARRLGNIPLGVSFIDTFRTNRRWNRDQGEYLELIKAYEHYFPLGDQLLVLFYDDIITNPQKTIQALCDYLNVPIFLSPKISQLIGATADTDTLSEADETEVRSYYRPFNMRLANYLDRDLSSWDRSPSGSLNRLAQM